MSDMNKEMRVVLYHIDDTDIDVNAIIQNDSIWITQKAMAEIFSVDKSNISRHLKNIFNEGELDENMVVAKIATTTKHGAIPKKTQTKEPNFYNLDAIISVGYRVNSKQAKEKAEAEYDIFNRTQHIYSDFDKAVGLIDSRK